MGSDLVIVETLSNPNDSVAHGVHDGGVPSPQSHHRPHHPSCSPHPLLPPCWLCAALTVDALRVGDGPAADGVVVLLVAHQGVHPQDGCRTPVGSPRTPDPPAAPGQPQLHGVGRGPRLKAERRAAPLLEPGAGGDPTATALGGGDTGGCRCDMGWGGWRRVWGSGVGRQQLCAVQPCGTAAPRWTHLRCHTSRHRWRWPTPPPAPAPA